MTNTQSTPSIPFITRILLWLSKTDKDLYSKSPENVKYKRKSLGLLVLFIMVLSFFTASYFVRTLLQEYDPASHRMTISAINMILSYIIGVLFAAGSVCIDPRLLHPVFLCY